MRLTATVTGKAALKRALDRRLKDATEANYVEIGFFPEQNHPEAGVPLAQVAAWQEFGTPEAPYPAPARPFMRYTAANDSRGWAEEFAAGFKAVGHKAKPALKGMGKLIKMQMQNNIRAWSDPPNAESTIRTKGRNNPLIDTRYMHNRVKYKVGKE
jgi:hypothetical protein